METPAYNGRRRKTRAEGRMGWVFTAVTLLTLALLVSQVSGRETLQSLVPVTLPNRPPNDQAYDRMNWWNAASVARIWGCDKCKSGDVACSLGASMAEKSLERCCDAWDASGIGGVYAMFDQMYYGGAMGFGPCCWPPVLACCSDDYTCGYWNKTADYYGYEDRDDDKADVNPLYKWYDEVWDTKYDYESGRPDEMVVGESIKSINTNMSAFFIIESTWKGRPYWLHLNDPTPSYNAIDYQQWLMPCANENENVEYWCRWTKCEKFPDDLCTCYPSNSTFDEDLCNSLTCPAATGPCWSWNGQCWQNPPEQFPCNDGVDYAGHPYCDTCDGWSEGDPYTGYEPSAQAGGYCCWNCDPFYDDGGYHPVEPVGFCGIGGAAIEKDQIEVGHLNYTDYPLRLPDGEDMNDDLGVANSYPNLFLDDSSDRVWPGQMPAYLPRPLPDDDFVRDRYWKRNATDTEFRGSRPGYCAYETTGVVDSCVETLYTPRDTENRPISKQHDTCRVCGENFDKIYLIIPGPNWPDDSVPDISHNLNNPICPDECFTYDLRYYRQVNLDSMWANIFKIAPELTTLYTGYPPSAKYPGTAEKCELKRPGVYPCTQNPLINGTKMIGDPCTNTSDCIGSTYCTGSYLSPDTNKHCCPLNTYYWNNSDPANPQACCRSKLTHSCSRVWLECPTDKRDPLVSTHWDEFTANYTAWVIENFYGVKPPNKYLIGLGEKGCTEDIDCAKYVSPINFFDVTLGHCSYATDKIGQKDAAFTKEPQGNHCCKRGYEWDLTRGCCMPQADAVKLVKSLDHSLIYRDRPDEGISQKQYVDTGYCEEKIIELGRGKKCERGEGPCRIVDRQGNDIPMDDSGQVPWECATGLNCTNNWYSTSPWETACCGEKEKWNGRECEPLAQKDQTPYLARWTRGGPGGDGSGGPIKVYSGAGMVIPNGSEAAGWGNTLCWNDARWTGPWPKAWGLSCAGVEHCGSCEGGWPYRCPPSPIWFEARNFGNAYEWDKILTICNGPFEGRDSTVKAFPKAIPYDDPYLDCMDKDCNCGRAFWGPKDKIDGVIDDIAGPDCGGDTCNYLQDTACKRGLYNDVGDPATDHRCNCVPRGHGGFNEDGVSCMGPIDEIANSTPVPPKEMPGGEINADLFVPEICGRIQRKEVETQSGYYPRSKGDSPTSWFDYLVFEYDENHQQIAATPYPKQSKGKINLLPEPPSPHTVLRDDKLELRLSPQTRYIKVEMNYTVENEIKRVAYVKQCMWYGCSRLEEVLYHFSEHWEHFHCGDFQTFDGDYGAGTRLPSHTKTFDMGDGCYYETRSYTGGCCCLREDKWVDFADCAGGSHASQCGGCVVDTCYEMLPDGTCVPFPMQGWDFYFDDCDCKYACWGCWHYTCNLGTNYPVTRPNPDTGKEELVYEEINDTSIVSAKPYGDDNNLRVENDITQSGSEVKTKVTGRLVFGEPGNMTYAMGYLNFVSYDDESEKNSMPHLDLFGGFRLAIPNITVLSFSSKQYVEIHDLTALQSTLPHDYIMVPNNISYLLRLNDMCYRRKTDASGKPTVELENHTSAEPMYLKWLFNPTKKFYNAWDLYYALGTKYTWAIPLVMADRTDDVSKYCQNNFDEKSPVIGLYRNFHEDEPLFYDYESFQMRSQEIERNLKYFANDPKVLGGVSQHELQKPIQNIYARKALPCDEEPYRSKKITDCGNCPDMCSDIADVTCAGGKCDCKYKAGMDDLFPIIKDVCSKTMTETRSQNFPCDGRPSRYKSYCSDGKFYALYLDQFYVTYKGDGSGGCIITPGPKTCDFPKELPVKSYTLIFEPSATITQKEWLTAFLQVENAFRDINVSHPFGTQGPCAKPDVTEADAGVPSGGGLSYYVQTPRPTKFVIQAAGPGPGNSLNVKVTEQSLCGSGAAAGGSGCQKVYVNFEYPYYSSSGFYQLNTNIQVNNIRKGSDIKASVQCFDDGGFYVSRSLISTIEVGYSDTMCDFMMDHIWVLLLAYVLVMSYRYFSGRAMDFKDMFDEYQGKK